MKTIVEEFKTYLMEDGKSKTPIQSNEGDINVNIPRQAVRKSFYVQFIKKQLA